MFSIDRCTAASLTRLHSLAVHIARIPRTARISALLHGQNTLQRGLIGRLLPLLLHGT